jgi:hypothetical protein
MEKQYFPDFIGSIDFELYQKMYSMSATAQYLASSQLKDTVWRITREKVFLNNMKELLNIVKKDGYPGERKLGFYATSTTGSLLIHNAVCFDTTNNTMMLYVKPDKADTAVINELREYLKPLVMKGMIKPAEYVLLYDNIVALKFGIQKMQYYGQYINTAIKIFVPIWDIKNVDERRAEIGLPSLYEYAQMKNVELPKDYPIPPEYVKK